MSAFCASVKHIPSYILNLPTTQMQGRRGGKCFPAIRFISWYIFALKIKLCFPSRYLDCYQRSHKINVACLFLLLIQIRALLGMKDPKSILEVYLWVLLTAHIEDYNPLNRNFINIILTLNMEINAGFGAFVINWFCFFDCMPSEYTNYCSCYFRRAEFTQKIDLTD